MNRLNFLFYCRKLLLDFLLLKKYEHYLISALGACSLPFLRWIGVINQFIKFICCCAMLIVSLFSHFELDK